MFIHEIQQLRAKQDELLDVIKSKDSLIAQLTEQVANLVKAQTAKNNPSGNKANKNPQPKDGFPALPTQNKFDALN